MARDYAIRHLKARGALVLRVVDTVTWLDARGIANAAVGAAIRAEPRSIRDFAFALSAIAEYAAITNGDA